jgi:hypothetical protein
MSEKRKLDRKSACVRRAHLAFGRVADPELAALSCELDAAEDRRWFQSHAGQAERVRPPSLTERAAFDLPDGTVVVVKKLKSGAQMRTFGWPQPLSALPGRKPT